MTDVEQLQRELQEILEALRTFAPGSRAYRKLSDEKAAIEAELIGSGAIAQGDNAFAVGADGVGVNGGVGGDLLMNSIKIVLNPEKKSLPHPEALVRYLENMISSHQLLRLQGIRAGDQPLSVLLEKVYVSLTAVDKQAEGATLRDKDNDWRRDSSILSIGVALTRYPRLVIIGDPGSGKTILMAYLALTYARTLGTADNLVKSRLGLDRRLVKKSISFDEVSSINIDEASSISLDEASSLPILLPLRDLGRHLMSKEYSDLGTDGPMLLLNFLREDYAAQDIRLPEDFFTTYLESGQATVLLDGMDEVADTGLRQRVARLIEKFAQRYEKARFVVTSREVGYDGAARIAAGFGLAKVRDFTPPEVRLFVRDWTQVVESSLAGGESADVLRMAKKQAEKLIQAIEHNPRVAELAINPLLLTVIALVHRYRAQLPERRSELYEEAVEVLLWHWDKAKGLEDEQNVAGVRLDSGDRRSLLEPVAFWMHEKKRREIELTDLRVLLLPRFVSMTGDPTRAVKAVDAFLQVINERSGLLIERGIGVFGFAHLTFQEYLTARALAGREDMLEYTLNVLPDAWWREVILLEAGYLSNQGPGRVSKLIATILDADTRTEPEPHHYLLLAAECLFDVGPARVEDNLLGEARQRLQAQADLPIQIGNKPDLLVKIQATNALARIESGQFQSQYWQKPWGEPQWVTIPAGEFWIGGDGEYDGKPVHRFYLLEYQIACVPVTNAQYALYIQDAQAKQPEHWRGGKIPKGLENHPAVNVTWDDALAYCKWLSEKTGKNITLASEAEWEKAARGSQDRRVYPWGSAWKELHCNSNELGLNETTPVGLFLNGASPYGLLDMSGNVWEWTRSIWDDFFNYPYTIEDGREDLTGRSPRVMRGGAFDDSLGRAHCSYRSRHIPLGRNWGLGFRVVMLLPPAILP